MPYRSFTPASSSRLEDQLREQLRPDEKLVWSGQPIPKLHRRGHGAAVGVSIIWNLFLVFWTGGVLSVAISSGEGFAWGMLLFSLPFWAIGIGLAGSPFWAQRKAERTIYGLSDQRAIILVAGRSVSVRTFALAKLGDLELTLLPDGTGDVILETDIKRTSKGTTTTKVGFIGIAQAKDVAEALDRTRAESRA